MGMPNAYKCEICSNDVYFLGTPEGEWALQTHYQKAAGHDISAVPTVKKAYHCHHSGCDVYKDTVCEMLQHDRSTHNGK
jgi:hypothetical protein